LHRAPLSPACQTAPKCALALGRFVTYTGGREDLWKARKQLYDEESAQIDELLDVPARAAGADGLPGDGFPKPAITASASTPSYWPGAVIAIGSGALIVGGALSILRRRWTAAQ